MTIEVQCTSCHTRYRIDEQVLPEGTPTFKCSRCGHVFTLEPRGGTRADGANEAAVPPAASRAPRMPRDSRRTETDTANSKASAAPPSAPAAVTGDAVPAAADDLTPPPVAISTPSALESEPAATEPKPADGETRPSTDELLAKPFRDDGPPSGENLKFDFSEQHPEPRLSGQHEPEIVADRHGGEWQVGESDFEPHPLPLQSAPGEIAPDDRAGRAEPSARVRGSRPARSRRKTDEGEPFLDESVAPIYNRSSAVHSARFFVAIFALVALGYGVVTLLIHGSPATAADILSRLPKVGDHFIMPLAPARMVAMRDVHSDYLRTKGGHTALVVTGMAQNVSERSLHAVRIAASLRDSAQHLLARSAVYCGNNLSAPMVAQMTPHELEFFLKLDPPKTFTMEPAATSQFVLVFIDPPAAVSGFDVSVASATSATETSTAAGGG